VKQQQDEQDQWEDKRKNHYKNMQQDFLKAKAMLAAEEDEDEDDDDWDPMEEAKKI